MTRFVLETDEGDVVVVEADQLAVAVDREGNIYRLIEEVPDWVGSVYLSGDGERYRVSARSIYSSV